MKYLILLLCLFANEIIYSQVGINTSNPLATLDINGNLKIRTVNNTSNPVTAKNSILVVQNDNVEKIPLKQVFNEEFKSAVKGIFHNNPSTVSISLLSGNNIIPFDGEVFDNHNEFDTNTHTFKAKENGIYSISVHIKQSVISVSSNFGVRVLKNGTVIHKNSFANVSLGLTNVTPPNRSINTLLTLNANDEITFELESSALGVALLTGTSASNYFTIHRIR